MQIKANSYSVSIIHVLLKDNILNLKSAYFDYHIDLENNSILGGNGAHFELNLLLFCPFHTSIEYQLYEYKMNVDIYNGKIANDSIKEILLLEDFQIISDSSKNSTDVIYYQSNNPLTITLPYFDYSKMSLSKLREKLKTYILFL